jgi:hypothetical protein
MMALSFDNYVAPLRLYLARYRLSTQTKRPAREGPIIPQLPLAAPQPPGGVPRLAAVGGDPRLQSPFPQPIMVPPRPPPGAGSLGGPPQQQARPTAAAPFVPPVPSPQTAGSHPAAAQQGRLPAAAATPAAAASATRAVPPGGWDAVLQLPGDQD